HKKGHPHRHRQLLLQQWQVHQWPSTVASPSVAKTAAAPASAQRLYVRCSFKEYLENPYQLDGEQFKRGGQSILRGLIGKVARLGLKGITEGRLTAGNILVIGNKAENLEVEILDTPQKYNQALPSYREQFRKLASEMVDAWEATCLLAWSQHFFEMLDNCIPWFYFKQLEWHPLLLSSHEVAVVIFRLYTHLDVEKKGWKNNYKELITRENVDFGKIISRTGRGAFAFSKKSEIQLLQKPEEIPADALLTREEIENTLTQAFPEVPLELFDYMLHKHIDINAAIT
ncbi:PREDICTED: LOC109947000, partial [Prunus dulcis]